MRVYDPRLGKFLSVDPLTKDFPWYTPYQFAGNKPIWAIDLDGAEEVTTTPEVEVGNVYVRPNGRLGIGPGYSLGGLPGGFSTLDVPGLRTLTTDEFDALIPPHGGFSLDKNKAGGWVTGVNGHTWHVSLLTTKPYPVNNSKSRMMPTELDFKIRGVTLLHTVSELEKKENDKEYFYRAMSIKEFYRTGGLPTQRENTGKFPFITQNLDYIRNKKSFIWDDPLGYQLLIKYTVTKGTKNYLEGVSVWGFEKTVEEAARNLQVIRKNEAYTTFGGIPVPDNINYGFPGKTSNVHFNPRITKIEAIDMSTPGLKKN